MIHPGTTLALKQNKPLRNHCKWKIFQIFTETSSCSLSYSWMYIILKGTDKEQQKKRFILYYTIRANKKISTSFFFLVAVLNTLNSVLNSCVDVFYLGKYISCELSSKIQRIQFLMSTYRKDGILVLCLVWNRKHWDMN